MAKGPSKARPARVNIEISDALRGGLEPELPFRLLVMGDYTSKPDKRPIQERTPQDISKSNFDAVMRGFNLSLDMSVPDRISGQGEMPVSLKFGTLKDFRPESIAQQVPATRNLLELRKAMKALRPKTDEKSVQKDILAIIKDPTLKSQILSMIATSGAPSGQPTGPAPQPEAGKQN
jgi:type VI secretion system protein ImpB